MKLIRHHLPLLLAFTWAALSCKPAAEEEETPKPTGTSNGNNSAATFATQVPGQTTPVVAGSTVLDASLVSVSVNGVETTMLNATSGQTAQWSFTARSLSGSGSLVVYKADVNPKPATMIINGNNSSSVNISWTPSSSDPASGQVSLTIRDTSICQTAKAATPSLDCNNFSTPTAGEVTRSLQYAVTGNLTTGNNGVTSSNSGSSFPLILSVLMSVLGNGSFLGGGMGLGIGGLGGNYQGGYIGGARYTGQQYQGQLYQGQLYQGQQYQGQLYQGQLYQGQQYQGQLYQGQLYQGQSYQGQLYQGQQYQGQSYQGQLYQGQQYQGQLYQGQSYTGQPYTGQPYTGRP